MLVPIGMYRARAVEAELCSMSHGTEHVHVLFEIVEGEHEGQFLPWFGFFTDATAKRTVESLRFCGWRGCDLSDLDGVSEDEVAIEVEHWLHEGRTHARVGDVRHRSRLLAASAMPPDRARGFAERMRGFILGLKHRPAPASDGGRVCGGDTQRLFLGPDGIPYGPSDEIVPF